MMQNMRWQSLASTGTRLVLDMPRRREPPSIMCLRRQRCCLYLPATYQMQRIRAALWSAPKGFGASCLIVKCPFSLCCKRYGQEAGRFSKRCTSLRNQGDSLCPCYWTRLRPEWFLLSRFRLLFFSQLMVQYLRSIDSSSGGPVMPWGLHAAQKSGMPSCCYNAAGHTA